MKSATPHLGRATSPATKPLTARQKNAKSRAARAHAHVAASRWTTASAKKVSTSLPPLSYNRGPFTLSVPGYDWRLWAIKPNETVLMEEVEAVTWDDASAVLTGSITFHTPDWAQSLGLREGHKVRAEFSEDGANYTPCWTMRLATPNSDLVTRTRTSILVSDLNRLAQSSDDFVYAKGKGRAGGWRVDEVIRDICEQYQIEIQYLPVMNTRITNWHLIDQHPIDVIHSALLREKNHTGRKYAVSMDWQERLWVTPFRRPTSLLEIGPQIIAATGSSTHDPRFATALTVRTSFGVKVKIDRNGHRKVATQKLAVDVESKQGISLYGYIHRNVYSPDAASNADAAKEGKLFISAVAKPRRAYTATLPGLPGLRRLDAFKIVLPDDGISQIVYVSEAQHSLDAGSGYTTDTVLDFDDPFVDNKSLTILAKLSDVAVARSRQATLAANAATKKDKTALAHSRKGGALGRTQTPATKPASTVK